MKGAAAGGAALGLIGALDLPFARQVLAAPVLDASTISANTQVVGVAPRISKTKFTSVLSDAGSAAAADAGACYDAIMARNIDPLFLLAVFHHESSFGKAGVCFNYDTKSPGNTRNVRLPGLSYTTVSTGSGVFVKYHYWADGFADMAYRLVDPDYVYAQEGRTTVGSIIPRWAPTSDGNNPTAYISAVIADMKQWMQVAEIVTPASPPPVVASTDLIAIKIEHAPYPGDNFPGIDIVPVYITIHETANTSVGANAEMHARFVANGGGSENVSFHYCVDDTVAIEIASPYHECWHAGDGTWGPGNNTSIAIETCVNSDGNWERTKHNLALLVATLMHRHNIPLSNVVQHNHWSGKNCPTTLRANNNAQWNELMSKIATLSAPAPSLGNQVLQGGFKAFYDHFAAKLTPQEMLVLFGNLITNEVKENGQTVQYFERLRFEWHPGVFPEFWDVLLTRYGYDDAHSKGLV